METTGALRGLAGRKIRDSTKEWLTDIDALGYNDGRLLLISCKSIAFTVPALRGDHGITRNIVDKIHKAAAEWDHVVAEVNADHSVLKIPLDPGVSIEGCVVFPGVPYFTDPQWRRTVFGGIPYLLSIAELDTFLSEG